MPCTDPRNVGFTVDGKITFSAKKRTKELAAFQLPCGQCLECRLEYARQWAIRCVHEAKMHKESCFITLTYENLESPKLQYEDFQKFMKKLRKLSLTPIGVFVTGEYGEQNKRPHWHAIIFGWKPKDGKEAYKNTRGDQLYTSETLTKTWGKGKCDYGAVTFESAGYCARYAAKKLVHGKDQTHDYHPISKKSSKHAIGKKFLEQHFPDVFSHGEIQLRLSDRSILKTSIPRYYERWFKDHHPDLWLHYVTHVKSRISAQAQKRSEEEKTKWMEELHRRLNRGRSAPLTKNQVKKIISEQKFQQLQNYLKL